MSTASDRYLDEHYLLSNPTWHIEDSPWKATQVLKMLDRNSLAPLSVCEVGCGAGEILNQLYDRLPSTTSFVGYDISPHAIELSKTREKDRLQFVLADFTEERNEYFDLILIMDVVEHVEDYWGFLRSLRDKSSHIIFHFPMDFSVYTALRQQSLLRGRQHMGHIHYFNRSTALATVEDAGFEVIDTFFTSASADNHKSGNAPRSIASNALRQARRIFWKVSPELSVKIFGGAGLLVLAR